MSWDVEGSQTFSISTGGTMGTPVLIYTNSESPARARTVVDGYVTIITDTDELCQVRMFGPVPGFASSGDFAFSTPVRAEAVNWYWFNCGRGPMVFRVRSKRTFETLEELWMAPVKLQGASVINIRIGYQRFFNR